MFPSCSFLSDQNFLIPRAAALSVPSGRPWPLGPGTSRRKFRACGISWSPRWMPWCWRSRTPEPPFGGGFWLIDGKHYIFIYNMYMYTYIYIYLYNIYIYICICLIIYIYVCVFVISYNWWNIYVYNCAYIDICVCANDCFVNVDMFFWGNKIVCLCLVSLAVFSIDRWDWKMSPSPWSCMVCFKKLVIMSIFSDYTLHGQLISNGKNMGNQM